MSFILLAGLIALLTWLYLAFLHGRFWQPLLLPDAPAPHAWPDIDIVIPTRDEAEALPQSLPSLLSQDYPGSWRIILVDDHSADGTGDIASRLGGERITVIAAPELPQGWSGKLAAMNAGVARSKAEYVLFTDADIYHAKDSLRRLAARAKAAENDLTSLMVKLHCASAAEKLLIPAFVFFFALLYPFRRANDPASPVAAAAGGVMLVRRKVLESIGGLAKIKSALIDDCALASAIKRNGGKIELAMTEDVISLRPYPRLKDIWRMVARTAYTQLNYSPLALVSTVGGMSIMFAVPVLLALQINPAGITAWLVMSALYLPMVHFYKLPAGWALTLPAAALVYIGATIDSARLYWQGKGGQWKGRSQA